MFNRNACKRYQILVLQKKYQNMDCSNHKSVLHTNKFKVASSCSSVKVPEVDKTGKLTQTRRPFLSKLFQKHDCVISARTTTPRQKQTFKKKLKHVLILVLPCLFDNVDSKVGYRFPLSFKRQSNLHFWPLFDEKL